MSDDHHSDESARVRVPSSTYRLQVHKDFPLTAAAEIVPYLQRLGVGDAYTSPLLQAGPGSMHGYDVTDPSRVSEDAGGGPALSQFHGALRDARMGHLLDIVPNHMGATHLNPWWADVLTHGPASPYSDYFDIDWQNPPRERDRGRVVLPRLGSPSGEAIDAGDVKIAFDAEGPAVLTYGRRLPMDPRTVALVFGEAPTGALGELVAESDAARWRDDATSQAHTDAVALSQKFVELFATDATALEAANRQAALVNADRDWLERVLDAQVYRLTHWKAGSDEINYRRFFDVSDLISLRADRPEVFEACHSLFLDWLADGSVTGLRIDHPDGLADPKGYLERLRDAAVARTGQVPYVVVEKILGPGEEIRPDWPCAGASGYEFISTVTPLFIDPDGGEKLAEFYATFTGRREPVHDLETRCKYLVLDTSFAADLHRVVDLIEPLARANRSARDLSRHELTIAVRAMAAAFPVYRSYCATPPHPLDAALIEKAAATATERFPERTSAIAFVKSQLDLTPPQPGATTDATTLAQEQQAFLARFGQLTAPATAKGFEDTALYRHARLLALNEVGTDPEALGVKPEEVHEFFRRRPRGSLSPLSTHDTKRGEDARARLCALSEFADDWAACATRWVDLTEPLRTRLACGRLAPSVNELLYFWQTLFGAWPAPNSEPATAPSLSDRIVEFAVKALHEGKENSSWRDADDAYDAAVCDYLRNLLDPAKSAEFLKEFDALVQKVAKFAAKNSLAQTLLRLSAPGVPDTYQGSELWEYSLVDPDNRRPVDYGLRERMMADLDARVETDPRALCLELSTDVTDARGKMYLTMRALRFRKARALLFSESFYVPLEVTGPAAKHVFAFLREFDGKAALVAVPRLTASLPADSWAETVVHLPDAWRGKNWACAFTHDRLTSTETLPCAKLFETFSVALLSAE